MRKILKKNFLLFIALVMVLGIAPFSLLVSAADEPVKSTPPGVPTPVWEMAKDEAINALEDGAAFTAAGPVSVRNSAAFTVRKNTIIPEVHGWDFLGRSTTAVDVARPAANDGFRISAAELGLIPGEVYIFEIEGRRPDGTHRPAFGTINAAGTIAINGAAVGPVANNHPTRPGYFDMKRMITHTENIEYYVFYGVGSANTTVAAGTLQLYNITIAKANPFVIYSTDFSDGTRGLVTGTIDGQHSVIPDSQDPSNNVYCSTIPPATSGNWHGYDLTNPDYEWPAGATFRATFIVRRAEGNAVNARLRLAVQTGGSVSNWDIAGQAQQLGTGWTTYTVGPFTLDPGVGVQSFQFIRNNESWTGTMELNSVLIEVIEAPAEELVGLWESSDSIPSIAQAYKNHFPVGNILDRLPGPALEEMFLYQYNSITMENAMKPAGMSPSKGVYTFDHADSVVDWALDNGVQVIGHALLWHSQSAAWLTNNPVTNATLTRAEAKENLEEFITNVANHFTGRVSAWDVANEVFTNNGGSGLWTANMRTDSPWYRAYNNGRNAAAGEQPWDFLYDAFVFARLADPNAKLIKNDFNDNSLNKARNMRDMANELNAKWARDLVNNVQAKDTYVGSNAEIVTQYIADGGRILVETLGLQMHHGTGTTIRTPANGNTNLDWNVENSLLIFKDAVGVTLAITELDIQAGAGYSYNPVHQFSQYKDLFELFIEYSYMIDRVTFWGVSDVQSWRGPQSPQLFARPTANDPYFRAKPAFHAVVDLPCKCVYGDWDVIETATCLEKGLKERTCELCGFIETGVIPALGHDFVNAKIVSVVNKNRITTIEFTVDCANLCCEVELFKYSIQVGANNVNVDGSYVFDEDHELAGYILLYDIKGNGSNIKAFIIG